MVPDETDLRLLRALQKDGRLSNADLAERVHLSPSACHRRVARLEADGLIAGYTARLDARKMGFGTAVFVEITLSSQSEAVLDAFEAAVARVPAILECHLMTGEADYLLKIAAADAEDFARLHRQYLTRLPHVARMQSAFALKTILQTTALPV